MSLFPTIGYGYYGVGNSYDTVPAPAPDEIAKPDQVMKRPYVAGGQTFMPGFDKAPPGNVQLYWQACKYSALVLAYAVTCGPIFAGTRTLELLNADGDEVDPQETKPSLTGNGTTSSPADKQKKMLERHFEPLWPDILNGLECLNYGYWNQEVVWERSNGLTLPVRFKDFLPWEAVILRDPYGDFAGLKYNNEKRGPAYCLHHVHQSHKDPLFGYPRPENCREDWWRAIQSGFNGDRLERKASGISMLVLTDPYYSFKNPDGTTMTGPEVGQVIYNGLAAGGSAWGPRYTMDQKSIMHNPALADHSPITAEQFDWGSTSQSMMSHIARLDALDKRIMRGYCRPEREAMEGHYGTKAESAVQGQIGVTDSERVHTERVTDFNTQTWQTVIRTNGLAAMRWRASPLADPQALFYQEFAKALLANPVAGAEAVGRTDIPDLWKKCELPIEENYRPLPALPMQPTNGTPRNRMTELVR